MRRAVFAGMVLAALASGCGSGGSDGAGRPSAPQSGSPGSAATVTPQATDGRLGGAVVARPGLIRTLSPARRIEAADLRGRGGKAGVGIGAEAACADVDLQPTPQNLSRVSDAVFCLMNAMRGNAGVPALRQQDQLGQASVDHSQDMVDQQYFSHDSLDGRDLVARLRAVSYIPKSGEWVVGENLAWGAGSMATPKSLVNAWMNSSGHRQNLLSADFVEVGMGVVYGTPDQRADDGVTVTTDFGARPSAPVDSAVAEVAGSVTGARSAVVARRAAARRKRALRRCARKHGGAKRRCVRAARRIR